ncbi:hypothetical protein MKQ68_01970 [Chitinophaga horti]|uniref:Uncharacterized protein n=1 Tax=Chitinophaga horti TaxID=2920382 RepID=A0ABY6J2H3_9BACT|nr:hypothetical protein [Chitinophaga horti]UYQ93861.1 hypothetical protein MKQ68_01970 [Chitinophaga horti]
MRKMKINVISFTYGFLYETRAAQIGLKIFACTFQVIVCQVEKLPFGNYVLNIIRIDVNACIDRLLANLFDDGTFAGAIGAAEHTHTFYNVIGGH